MLICIKKLIMLLHKWICFILQRLRSDNKKNLQFIADTWKGENKNRGQRKTCIIPTTLQQISHHQVAVSWTIYGKIVLRLVTPLLSSNNNNQTNHQIKMAHSGLEMWIRERKNVSGVPLIHIGYNCHIFWVRKTKNKI